jgi:hypothetical protein
MLTNKMGAFRRAADKDIYDRIEGDAFRMALAILMQKTAYSQQLAVHRAEAAKQGLQGANIEPFCIERLAKDFNVTFNAACTRGESSKAGGTPDSAEGIAGAVIL